MKLVSGQVRDAAYDECRVRVFLRFTPDIYRYSIQGEAFIQVYCQTWPIEKKVYRQLADQVWGRVDNQLGEVYLRSAQSA